MRTPVVALAGSPNTGKTALFNALTGARQKTGNYPGVTVERKTGELTTAAGRTVRMLDLPGTYGLTPVSPDEQLAVDILQDKGPADDRVDVIVAIADSTNLERSLRFVLELKHLGKPIVVALNMMDLAARRGLHPDPAALEKHLGVPVVPTVAVHHRRVDKLIQAIDKALDQPSLSPATLPESTGELDRLQDLNLEVKEILARSGVPAIAPHTWTARIDRILLQPYLSGIFLLLILFIIFQAVFSWAEAPMEWIEAGIALLGDLAGSTLPAGKIHDLVVDGIIAGVGSVLVFLPQIILLFFFIFLLESSGYMMRAAWILDKGMARIGLQGLSLVPLLSSFACAIPGIMATRTIKNPRHRLITTLIAPLMTCSARLPVYVLLIGAFIPDRTFAGVINLQGMVMFGLFLAAILSAVGVTAVTRLVGTGGRERAPMMIELPTYKWPDPRNLALNLWQRVKIFLNRAGKLILLISMALWVLSTYPEAPDDWPEPDITYSLAGRIGKTMEPVLQPIGFDWRIATGLIPGFAAREVMVGAMGTVFAVEDAEDEEGGMLTLQEKMRRAFPLATGLALLAWYIFSPQCLATFAVMKRETNGWKWPLVGFCYMLALAWGAAFIVYRTTLWLSG